MLDKREKDFAKQGVQSFVEMMLGNKIETCKFLEWLASSPFFIREQLFWRKLDKFCKGAYLTENDKTILRQKLSEYTSDDDGACRLLEFVEKAETIKKIDYLINTTRCFIVGFIDNSMYFRICSIIVNAFDEDLKYLREHIIEHIDSGYEYNYNVQGLLNVGLMNECSRTMDGKLKYQFNSFAEKVDAYAISYRDENRYPNPKSIEWLYAEEPTVPSNMKPISADEIDAIWNEA